MDSTGAILLRKSRLTETSLIVTWLTEAEGKIRTVAQGALRARSRFAGVLDLFHLCEIQVARSRASDLHQLREVALLAPYEAIRFEYPRLQLASYFVELIELTTELEHPCPELFDLLRRALEHLSTTAASRRALLHFEVELAQALGIWQPGATAALSIGRVCHRLPEARTALLRDLEKLAAGRRSGPAAPFS